MQPKNRGPMGRPPNTGSNIQRPTMYAKVDVLNLEIFKTLCDAFALSFSMLDEKQQAQVLRSSPGLQSVMAAGLKLEVKKNGGIGD